MVWQEKILRKRQGVLGGIDHYYLFIICLYNTALPVGNIRFIQQVFWTTESVVYLHQTTCFPYTLAPMMYIPKDQYIPKQEYGKLIMHSNHNDCCMNFFISGFSTWVTGAIAKIITLDWCIQQEETGKLNRYDANAAICNRGCRTYGIFTLDGTGTGTGTGNGTRINVI